jgi:hypothetical protein
MVINSKTEFVDWSPDGSGSDKEKVITVPSGEAWYIDELSVFSNGNGSIGSRFDVFLSIIPPQVPVKADKIVQNAFLTNLSTIPDDEPILRSTDVNHYVSDGQKVAIVTFDDNFSSNVTLHITVQMRQVI